MKYGINAHSRQVKDGHLGTICGGLWSHLTGGHSRPVQIKGKCSLERSLGTVDRCRQGSILTGFTVCNLATDEIPMSLSVW